MDSRALLTYPWFQFPSPATPSTLFIDQPVTAGSAMGAPFGIEFPTLFTAIIHLAGEPVGKHGAQHQYAAEYSDGQESVTEVFHAR
jgi:hypothetical protein